MPRARPALLALAAAAAGSACADAPAMQILEVRYQGGSPDDRAFAAAAAALAPGLHGEAALRLALDSIRATDRFRDVSQRFEEFPTGRRMWVVLDPWPSLHRLTWEGDALDRKRQKALFPGLVRKARLGALRLEAVRLEAEGRLREGGYPQAKVGFSRLDQAGHLAVRLELGHAAKIERIEWQGDPSPYTQDKLLAVAGIQPGITLWTPSFRREAQAKLRKRFLADRHYEGQAELAWSNGGTLRLRVQPGPRIQLAFEGDRVRWTGVKDLVPVAWADRYTADLLDQGDRRIQLFLQGEGYKDAQVTHRRDAVEGAAEARIVYTVRKGPKASVDGVVFERNREVPSEELLRAAQVPRGAFGLGAPAATPELIDAVVERVRGCYLRKGFADVTLRRWLDTGGGRTRLRIQVREGERRFIESLVLQCPAGPRWNAAELGVALYALLGERSSPVPGAASGATARRADRLEMNGAVGTLEILPQEPDRPLRQIRLSLDRPIPFVKTDLALVLASLRQQVGRFGTLRPLFPRLSRSDGEKGERILVEVADQQLNQVQRLVVRGSDQTRPEAVLREAALAPGLPLDPDRLIQAQARIGNLGAFEHVDLAALAESPHPEPRPDWKEGDLLLRLQERPNWVFSTAFGYDRISGYHIGLGAQRLNFQGLGRTLDFNLRAGDATLRNPGLRNFFTTGAQRRSVDIYSVGYSDPWFAPGRFASWLPERTEYRAEAAYLDEIHAPWDVRRRRVLNSLKWKPFPTTEIRLGHRFERVEVGSIAAELPLQELEEWLNALTGSLQRVVISAPYLQYTRDHRDNPFDPTRGTYFFGKLELANQLWGTSRNASFVKLDLRHQWNWPVGYRAGGGVLAFGARLGLARPTDSNSADLPLSERFFAGGPGSNRGVEPDYLGPSVYVPLLDPKTGKIIVKDGFRQFYLVPTGGQGLLALNLEYRFPISPSVWLEVFVDSGQVYASLDPPPGARDPFPPLRTSLGAGLILKLGIPLKIEYGADIRRILGRPRSEIDRATQLKNVLISAGFQF